jgi:hypothetical protein
MMCLICLIEDWSFLRTLPQHPWREQRKANHAMCAMCAVEFLSPSRMNSRLTQVAAPKSFHQDANLR